MVEIPKSFGGAVQLAGMAMEDARAARAMIALAPEPGLPDLFASVFTQARYLYHDYAVYRCDRDETRAGNALLTFASGYEATDTLCDLGVVFLPKSREEIAFAFSAVTRVLQANAAVFVVGPKRSGIRSSVPLIEQYFGPVLDTRTARHCVSIRASKQATPAEFHAEAAYEVEALGRRLHVVTLPGVFSYGRLDDGTRFLLDHLPAAALDRALDWACGAGAIGCALKLSRPEAVVDLVDSHVMAVESTRRTLAANGLDPERAWPSDGLSDITGRYDLIVTNPPFHAGHKTDHTVTDRLIRQAGRHLTSRGRLVLVTNAFLKTEHLLRNAFRQVRIVAEDPRYKVIASGSPKRESSL
jgi:16S rRNA (guanine1207-N2)-methyltransferase